MAIDNIFSLDGEVNASSEHVLEFGRQIAATFDQRGIVSFERAQTRAQIHLLLKRHLFFCGRVCVCE